MFLCEKYKASEQDLANSVYTIYTLNNYDLKLIEMRVKGDAIYGIIFGGLMGGAIGASVYKSKDKNEEKPDENSFSLDFDIDTGPLTGCCIGGFLGAAIGGIILFNITNDEIVYEQVNSEEYDFIKLNIYARYVDKEPAYLGKIK